MTPFITRLGFRAGALCSHQGGHVLNLHHPRHHGSGRQLQQPLQAPFFNCPAQNEDFGPAERGPAGPQNQNLRDKSIYIRLSVDPFRPMHVIHFPKAIICIYKCNQKLDGGG